MEAAKSHESVRPVRQITLQEAQRYTERLSELMQVGDLTARQHFLAAMIRRVVVFEEEGVIELAPNSALNAIEAVSGQLPKNAHDILSGGTPNGIRTRVATLKGWCPGPLDDGGSGDRGRAHGPAANQQCTRRAAPLSSALLDRRLIVVGPLRPAR